MVYGPRAGVGTWIAVGFTAMVVVAPLVVVVAAPGLAATPKATTATETQTAIDSAAPPGRLEDQLAALPIVVADFPDAPSRQAAAEYGGIRARDPASAFKMFYDTLSSLNSTSADAVDRLGAYLVSAAPDPVADFRAEVHSRFAGALPGLASDPRNTDRLNNAAVSLFDLGITWNLTPIARPERGYEQYYGSIYEWRALLLLHEIDAAMPPNRAVLLNSAYLTSVLPGPCGPAPSQISTALAPAHKWASVDPGDFTGTALVASLVARDITILTKGMQPGHTGPADTLVEAFLNIVLRGQTGAPALGSAVTGDTYLAAASMLADQAPYEARSYADQARLAYAKALSITRDPGLLAGLAASLDMLGQKSAALKAQRAAVDMAPNSVPLLLGLAGEEETGGDFTSMRSPAQQALSLAASNQNTPLRNTRLVAVGPVHGDRGYLGYSFGSDRERTPVYYTAPGCGGAGFLVSNTIPAVDDSGIDDRVRSLPEPDSAAIVSLRASLLLVDPTVATKDFSTWLTATGAGGTAAKDSLWLGRAKYISNALGGVYVASGRTLPSDVQPALQFAESHLRHAGAVSGQSKLFTRAAVLCKAAADGQGPFARAPDPSSLQHLGLLCEGEAYYHAGDFRNAAAALQQDYKAYPFSQAGAEAAVALWRGGDPEAAHRLLIKHVTAAGDPRFTYGAHELLGELALDQGDPRAALDHFEQALGAGAKGDIAAHAYNNRGVALLWRAQSAPDTPPNCSSDGGVCNKAREDFGAALSFDPSNPYFLQNAAWADQLMNLLAESKDELEAASVGDPRNYPVRNDLGVMQAKLGNLAAARQNFEAALRARPHYDLAAWNLGVLEMQQGPLHALKGQSYLALATRENPRFRGNSIQYKVDNRFYRAAFGLPLQQVTGASVNSFSQAAQVAGGIAAVSALDDVLNKEVKSKLVELLRLRVLPGFPLKFRELLQQIALFPILERLPGALRTWLTTGLLLALVTAAGIWLRPTTALGSEIALALLAVAAAVLVHECGHLVAACVGGIKLTPATSPLGIVVSFLFIPLRSSLGPYAGHRLLHGELRVARWVYLAGPGANLLAAVVAYGLFLVQPLPFLRLLAGVQLAAAAFSLMPFEPLDGAALSKRPQERSSAFSLLPLAMAFVVGLAGLGLTFGRL